MKRMNFTKFESMVSYFKKKLEENRKEALLIYYHLGHQVRLIKEKAIYGDNDVNVLAQKLNISRSLLYRFGQFASLYTEYEVDKLMKKAHMGWGVVHKLVSIKDKKDRIAFEDKLQKGTIKPSRLGYAINSYWAANKEKVIDRTPHLTSLKKRLKSVLALLSQVNEEAKANESKGFIKKLETLERASLDVLKEK